MKVLIIGANGLLGSAIMKKCLERNWETDCVYNINHDQIDARCRLISVEEMNQCKDCYDFVFSCAGNFSNSYKELIKNNIITNIKCNEMFPLSKLVYISSIEVFGKHEGVISESSSFNCPSAYGKSKIAGEFIVSGHERWAIVRPSIIVGKKMNKNTFICRSILSAKQKGKITLWGKGIRVHDYISSEDIAEICLLASMQNENDIYIGASGFSYSNYEIALMIQKHIECDIEFTGTDESPSFVFDNSKTREKLGYTTLHTIGDIIKNLTEAL